MVVSPNNIDVTFWFIEIVSQVFVHIDCYTFEFVDNVAGQLFNPLLPAEVSVAPSFSGTVSLSPYFPIDPLCSFKQLFQVPWFGWIIY
jgi:hypothetical protein